jgi:hypothetical protein
LDHVHRAIYDYLLPSDKTFLEGMAAARNTGRKSRPKPLAVLPEDAGPEFEAAPASVNCPPGRGRGNLIAHGSRTRAENEASLIEARLNRKISGMQHSASRPNSRKLSTNAHRCA